ncbi:MAG: hypothetical protein ACK476_04625 [Fluviicola sp.]|jgi:hypothetical protein
MIHFNKSEKSIEDLFIYSYNNISLNDLSGNVEFVLTSNGYKKEEIDAENSYYVKGNRVLRLLLGAFYKYFKFKVTIKEIASDEIIKVQVKKETSGMSGGLVGMNQVKNELARLANEFKNI